MTRAKCVLDGNPIVALGYCSKHYQRFKKYGDPEFTVNCPPEFTVEQRLKFHGWQETESGCWEFSGIRDNDGYGYISIKSVRDAPIRAHRLAYETWVGSIPDGHVVTHSCDNPPCINPAHLSVGTVRDNTRDMVEKRRGLVGSLNPDSTLTEDSVREIRALLSEGKYSQTYIGKMFDVDQTTISLIKRRKTWTHLI